MDTENTLKNWVSELEKIMEQLRDKENGCPWDIEQNHKSLKRCLIEEAYELIDAIDNGNDENMIEELGDVLLQVIFHCQLAKEENRFDLQTSAQRCCEKLIHRHPHVFSDKKLDNAEAVLKQWERIKRKEPGHSKRKSVLDGVADSLPALMQAEQIQKKAARVGFDWPSIEGVIRKIEEELDELKVSIAENDKAGFDEELGDLLFSVANLSRYKGKSPEDLLRSNIQKFYNRFQYVEDEIKKQNKKIEECSINELEELWQDAKEL